MSPRYVGRHSGGRPPRDANTPKVSPPHPPGLAARTVDRRTVKKIALWVALAVGLALSLAVLIGLVQGFHAMDHPPGGWCQDNSATCVHR
ncbi:hypothetical protein [Streptomyces lydicus]|uniref:hypothetical protein n=1 Tax=Streptomyces lydicus TaxID=47763 RepID=UPI0010109623|nr:hypothetical protein [Streptomyces lydicus]MCZ1007047.1 hypothetical protein [Streptomyces lydicus]